MTYEEAKKMQAELEQINKEHSEVLQQFPKQANGLIEEKYRLTDEYIQANKNFDSSFAKLRKINSFLLKTFKKQYLKERAEERAEKRAKKTI